MTSRLSEEIRSGESLLLVIAAEIAGEPPGEMLKRGGLTGAAATLIGALAAFAETGNFECLEKAFGAAGRNASEKAFLEGQRDGSTELVQQLETLKANNRKLAHDLRQAAKDPWGALIFAAGLGFMLGLAVALLPSVG